MSQSFKEQEANQFWCPHVRVAALIQGSAPQQQQGTLLKGNEAAVPVNRHPDRPLLFEDAGCIGARCANWSWENPAQKGPNKEGRCGLSNT